MFVKTMKSLIAGAMLIGMGTPAFAEDTAAVSIAGNMSVMSNYIWRGVPQAAPKEVSVSGGLDFSFAAVPGLTLGNWNATAGGSTETDYYLSYEGEAGDFGYSVGVTYYSYDWKSFGTKTDASGKTSNVASEAEYFFGGSYDAFSGTYYLTPAQDATWGQGSSSTAGVALDWLELGYETEALGYGIGLTYGTGTYNHQWLSGAGIAPETTAILTMAFSKEISENLSASFNKTHVMTQAVKDSKLSNEFWMALDYSF